MGYIARLDSSTNNQGTLINTKIKEIQKYKNKTTKEVQVITFSLASNALFQAIFLIFSNMPG